MVLILSDNFDPSTTDVINWLNYLKVKWIRINENDRIKLLSVEISDKENCNVVILVNNHQKIQLKEIKSYWYRRGHLSASDEWKRAKYSDSNYVQHAILNELQDDDQNAYEFIHHFLQNKKPNLNSFLSAKNNKLLYLSKAVDNGLTVPRSVVCTTKTELLDFYHLNNGKVICKSINEGFFFKSQHHQYYLYTSVVTLEDIETSNETFFPSFFQQNIEKFVELRVFYFHEKLFCMAIFSQLNEKTLTDFRIEDDDHPRREVPFCLPEHIAQKITQFMKEIKLNSGSIDMIITPQNEYYFLEVNPVGQFGFVSSPCNYNLEKKIADFLKYGNTTH